jgi:hypothetical protein
VRKTTWLPYRRRFNCLVVIIQNHKLSHKTLLFLIFFIPNIFAVLLVSYYISRKQIKCQVRHFLCADKCSLQVLPRRNIHVFLLNRYWRYLIKVDELLNTNSLANVEGIPNIKTNYVIYALLF